MCIYCKHNIIVHDNTIAFITTVLLTRKFTLASAAHSSLLKTTRTRNASRVKLLVHVSLAKGMNRGLLSRFTREHLVTSSLARLLHISNTAAREFSPKHFVSHVHLVKTNLL